MVHSEVTRSRVPPLAVADERDAVEPAESMEVDTPAACVSPLAAGMNLLAPGVSPFAPVVSPLAAGLPARAADARARAAGLPARAADLDPPARLRALFATGAAGGFLVAATAAFFATTKDPAPGATGAQRLRRRPDEAWQSAASAWGIT